MACAAGEALTTASLGSSSTAEERSTWSTAATPDGTSGSGGGSALMRSRSLQRKARPPAAPTASAISAEAETAATCKADATNIGTRSE